MRKKKLIYTISLIVVVAIALILIFVKAFSQGQLVTLTGLPQQSFLQAAVGTSLDGNSYYEERCIDVSQYYSQGYVNSTKDSHGCQIVSKQIPIMTMYLPFGGSCTWGNAGYLCNGFNTGDACNGVKPSAPYVWTGCSTGRVSSCPCGGCSAFASWSSHQRVDCSIVYQDTKGGFERVLNTCTFEQNDLLVATTFAGAKTITKADLPYPMKSVCRAHPSIITDDASKTSITSTNIPQDLIDGKTVSILAGQTLTVIYVIQNNYNLPTLCDPAKSLALDTNNTKICKSTLGFTYICGEGQFDALTGTCVVQPESSTVCEKGRYDVQLNACIYNPPINGDCSIYGAGYYYDVNRQICTGVEQQTWQCFEPYTFVQPSSALECTGVWQVCPQCPLDKICDAGICKAECSVGQRCVRNTDTTVCVSEISDSGVCTDANNQTVNLCGNGEKWDGESCYVAPVKKQVCTDGSLPTTNSITGQPECVGGEPKNFVDCPAGKSFSNGVCVDSILVYVPTDVFVEKKVTLSEAFIQYRSVQKSCQSDTDCGSISPNLVCNKPTGYCQTAIYAKSKDYTPVYLMIIAILIIGIIGVFIFRGRRRRRR